MDNYYHKKLYYSTGELKSVYYFNKGRTDGEIREYNKKGQIKRQYRIKNNKITTYKMSEIF